MLVYLVVLFAFAQVLVFAEVVTVEAGDPDGEDVFKGKMSWGIPPGQCNAQVTPDQVPCPKFTKSLYTYVTVSDSNELDVSFEKNDPKGPVNIYRGDPCEGTAVVVVKTHCELGPLYD